MSRHISNEDLLIAGIIGGVILDSSANNRAARQSREISNSIDDQTEEITKRLDLIYQFQLLTPNEQQSLRIKARRQRRIEAVKNGRARKIREEILRKAALKKKYKEEDLELQSIESRIGGTAIPFSSWNYTKIIKWLMVLSAIFGILTGIGFYNPSSPVLTFISGFVLGYASFFFFPIIVCSMGVLICVPVMLMEIGPKVMSKEKRQKLTLRAEELRSSRDKREIV